MNEGDEFALTAEDGKLLFVKFTGMNEDRQCFTCSEFRTWEVDKAGRLFLVRYSPHSNEFRRVVLNEHNKGKVSKLYAVRGDKK